MVVYGKSLETHEIIAGVNQASFLGFLLFILFINGQPRNILRSLENIYAVGTKFIRGLIKKYQGSCFGNCAKVRRVKPFITNGFVFRNIFKQKHALENENTSHFAIFLKTIHLNVNK